MPDPIAPLLRVLTPAVRTEVYPAKQRLLAQYAADVAAIEQQIGTLLEQRSRLQSLQSLVSRTQADLIEALMQGREGDA